LEELKEILFDKQINVYLGKNNPLFVNNHLAFIGTKSDKDKLIIALLTPKVTDYQDHFKLFNQLINNLN
jgi:transcriptional regulator of heat shock response